MTWRLARSLEDLRDEVNARWPNRSKASDGTIGDAAHASRDSDHNPWVIDGNGVGVVRAIDITSSGIDADWYAEHIRQLGAAGDPRLNPDGYVIWNRRIASAAKGWVWRTYTGSNPHDKHVHVSATTDAYDHHASWGIHGTTTTEEFTMDKEADAAFKALDGKLDRLLADAKTKTSAIGAVRSALSRIEAKLKG